MIHRVLQCTIALGQLRHTAVTSHLSLQRSQYHTMSIPPELLTAYEKSLYVVRSNPSILLRIGQKSEELAQLLAQYEADSGALLTSDNPRSEPRNSSENAFHRDQLQREVIHTQLPFLCTVSIDPSGQWPDEHGFLVFDLSASELQRLLVLFDQWAAVWIEKDGTVRIVSQRVESEPESD